MKEGDKIDLTAFKQDFGITDADGPSQAYTTSGDTYDTLVAGGIKSEGHDYPAIYKSEGAAITEYLKSLGEYLGHNQPIRRRHTVIIWRTRPELVVFTMKSAKNSWVRHYQVYSRLVAY